MNVGLGGLLSGGKSVTAVMMAVEEQRKTGKKIVSNIRLKGVTYTYLESNAFAEFITRNKTNHEILANTFQSSILILDEIRGLISARKSTSNLNELITSFLMMLGKLDTDLIFTYQVMTSMVDLQLREITNYFLDCMRVDKKTRMPITGGQRIIGQDILIRLEPLYYIGERLHSTGRVAYYDPKPYFQYYNTRELVLVDRGKYLTPRERPGWMQ